MKLQDNHGKEIEVDQNDENFTQYFFNKHCREMGDLLGLKGKFRIQYGVDQIKEAIKELKK